MRITAKLALNQVKQNRNRSLGAIFSILLSTALITAELCFISSAKAMLTDFLGESYGAYGGIYQLLLLVPALFFGSLIFVMAVTVISNVFQASANQRINEFGILKCVGGTAEQIRETVLFECIWLCLPGLPVGLLCGLGIGFWGVQLTGDFVTEIDELQQSIVMRPIHISLSFEVNVPALATAALFSFLTVLYAAYRPAKKAGRITALSCIRGVEEVGADMGVPKKVRGSLIRRCFGWEGVLAERNLRRNKPLFKSTIRALALGSLLLLCTGSVMRQVEQIKAYMDPGSRDVVMTYSSNRKHSVNEVTGRREEVIARPIFSAQAERVRQRLLEYGGVEIMGIGYDNATYAAIIDNSRLTEEMLHAVDIEEADHVELAVDLLVLDAESYQELCRRAGVLPGSNILLNYYRYNDNGRMKSIVPFTEELTELTLENAAGESLKVKVDGFLGEEQLLRHIKALNEKPVRLVVPQARLRFYDWYCQPGDEPAYMQYAREVGEEFFPTCTEDPYVQEGFMVRVSREDTMVMVMNIAIVIAELIIYGFIAVLLLIGIVSVISTLSTNIRMRVREFAILKSVGMTTGGIEKMLFCECVLCTSKALLYGVPAGLLLPYGMSLLLGQLLPVVYELPWGSLLGSSLGIFGLVLAVSILEMQRLKEQNIIETIRMKTV